MEKLQVAGPRWFSVRLGNRDLPDCFELAILLALNTRNGLGLGWGLEADRLVVGSGWTGLEALINRSFDLHLREMNGTLRVLCICLLMKISDPDIWSPHLPLTRLLIFLSVYLPLYALNTYDNR